MMKTGRLGGVSLIFAAGSLLLGTLASRPTDAAMARDKRLAIIKSVPLIVTLAQKDGKILGIASFGSGTVVTKQGHILTNNHVISFNHPLPNGITIVPERYVFITLDNNEDPKPICTFDPSHMPHDPVVDIAMVMCEHDLKGNAWDSSKVEWPNVSIGDPANMVQGDDLWVFGYPGAGQDPRKKNVDFFTLPSMNVSEGKFSGVVNEQDSETSHHISWVKTDAEISGGNSGGCATDDDGNYIGIPTEVHTDTRDTQGGDGGTLGHVGFLRPTNLLKPYIDMAQKGWTPGDGGGGDGSQAQPAGDGVIVSGAVGSADTGDPVANIVVIAFKDGVSAQQVLTAKNAQELMLTRAKSGSDGMFTFEDKVPKGSYTVAVIGQGYKLIIEDNALVIDGNTPANYRAWNKIPVTRCTTGADCIN